MYDQNLVDITGLIALSGDTITSTYADSWSPTTGSLVLGATSGSSIAISFYFVTDDSINKTYDITHLDPVVTSLRMLTGGTFITGTTETLVITNQDYIDITANVSLSADTNATDYVTSWTPSTGALVFTSNTATTEDLTFYYNDDATLTDTFNITLTLT